MFSTEESTPACARLGRTPRAQKTAAYAALCALALAFVFTGCQTPPKVKLPNVIGKDPTPQEFYEAVNANTAKIRSFHTSSARVGQGNMPGTAACSISYKEKDNFRLVGSIAMQGRMLDCGSNGQKFWYWNSMVDESNIYTCDIDKFKNSALSEEFPLDPSWFPEALGIIHIDPDDVIDGPYPDPRNNKRLAMKIKRQRPEGVYTELISFEPLTAEIVRQEICNPQGQKVVVVTCKAHNIDEATGAIVPTNLEIFCPAANITFILNIPSYKINDDNALMDFKVPSDLKDARVVDLSNGGQRPANSTNNNTNNNTNNAAPASANAAQQQSQPAASNAAQTPTDASQLKSVPIGESPVNNQAVPAAANSTTQNDANSGIVPFPSVGSAAPAPTATETPIAYEFDQETPRTETDDQIVAASIYSPAAGYVPNPEYANTANANAGNVPNSVYADAANAEGSFMPQTSFANAELDAGPEDELDIARPGSAFPQNQSAAYQQDPNALAPQQQAAQQGAQFQRPQTQQSQQQGAQFQSPQTQQSPLPTAQGQQLLIQQGQGLQTASQAQGAILPGYTPEQAAQQAVRTQQTAQAQAQNVPALSNAAQARPTLSTLKVPAAQNGLNTQNGLNNAPASVYVPAASSAPQSTAPSLYAPTQYPAAQQTQIQTNSPQPPVIFEEPELLEEPPLAEDPAPEAFPDDFPTLSF